MKTYNCLLALNGDRGNTVPIRRATVAELAVLREIHGGSGSDTPIFDIEDAEEDAPWGNRTERNRLAAKYPKRYGDRGTMIERLFPGVGTPVFETLDELALPDEAFKPTARAIPPEVLAQRAEEAAAAAAPTKRKRKAKAEETEAPAEPAPDAILG